MKMHAQVGREILVQRSRRALTEASTAFEKGLREAGAAATPQEARENYRLLGALWEEFRPLAAQAPSADGARKLAERTEEVAWIAAKGARMLHEQKRSRAGDLVLRTLPSAGRSRLTSTKN